MRNYTHCRGERSNAGSCSVLTGAPHYCSCVQEGREMSPAKQSRLLPTLSPLSPDQVSFPSSLVRVRLALVVTMALPRPRS